ncbi:RNA methyltransferase [Zavarzinia sp. CC-PAN008]|uniref:RNA methyltransferase n=1 Tax=Zavarzinia sp. CC-PAN008 TaxID=3243332 RepID=UPI003F745DBA
MAGTDRRQEGVAGPAPAVILVKPQMGENIGAAARAMRNFGLRELRLVAPRDGWPNEKAVASASGADDILATAQVFATTAEALGDLHLVLATTARDRDMVKPVITPRTAAAQARTALAGGQKVGLMFGAERMGLENDDVALADSLVQIPADPAFASLNLGQAVLILGYEWRLLEDVRPDAMLRLGDSVPATRGQLIGLFEQLEAELDEADFLKPPEKRPTMVRNLRNLFERAGLTTQEVQTLRGVVRALVGRRQRIGNNIR